MAAAVVSRSSDQERSRTIDVGGFLRGRPRLRFTTPAAMMGGKSSFATRFIPSGEACKGVEPPEEDLDVDDEEDEGPESRTGVAMIAGGPRMRDGGPSGSPDDDDDPGTRIGVLNPGSINGDREVRQG